MSLTNNTTFNVADASTLVDIITLPVLPAIGVPTSMKGRLIHPTLGTWDYPKAPDVVVNFDGDLIYGPTWSHTQTLTSGVDALWAGNLRDTLVTERWSDGVIELIEIARMLQTFYATPPDPATAFVLWVPNYDSPHTYNVIMNAPVVGGSNYTKDRLISTKGKGYVRTPIEISFRIVAKVS